ncbi:Nitrate reductase [NADH] [Triticum urartu]|uniref:Nitrate reductase [NADH] n=1 Tax=Triticum urartu TaxID=4572 RepID=M7ZJJ3_TRIUA|nr:Nitrate reductase [NADH] [Triticum urartu]
MVQQTVGFNWGAAGVSTSVWRGARLRDVLLRCGIMSSKKGQALNVCFEGAEDLPGGGGSKYGTSVTREWALDPSRDILLAYAQNGEPLLPDHGYPVRVLIPGCIGGRMVKWLRRIVVTPAESDNYYHFRDNRVLPSHVDAELANAEAWWYRPEYIINELNTNSVITTPGHDEILPINAFTTQRAYTIKGYAYSGGGKKVTRVEVTLDGGESWMLCTLDIPEKPNKYGRYWCWCFWSVEIEVLDLLGAKEVAVRAWDQTHNTQPEKLIWNLMGMMNNCWFKVKINVCRPHKGEIGLVFEHPTQPGNQTGGWMARQKHLETAEAAAPGLKRSTSTPFMNTVADKQFTMSEVRKHGSKESAWIVVHGHVYDCTAFLKDHPGGADSILINAGSDCTEDLSHLAPIREATKVAGAPIALSSPREKVPCRLVEKKELSHDVRLFRFALPSSDQVLGLPVGKHIFVCATIDGKLCMRAYTPTSMVDEIGQFELLVKVYFRDEHPKFPNGGLMTQYLESLQLGSCIDVIQAVLRDQPEDETEMHLVYANRSEDDILLRDELDRWAAEYPERLKVWYVIDQVKRPEDGWRFSVGFVTEDILRAHVPEGGDDTLALACGPPPMIKFAISPNLEKMKYDMANSFISF